MSGKTYRDLARKAAQLAKFEIEWHGAKDIFGYTLRLAEAVNELLDEREDNTVPLDLGAVGQRVHAWRCYNFGKQTRMRNALQICEEAGEVARAVGKESEGIRPETRGNLADELGDVILASCGMIAAEGLDVEEILIRRLARMESLDFTTGPEGEKG